MDQLLKKLLNSTIFSLVVLQRRANAVGRRALGRKCAEMIDQLRDER